MEHAMDDIRYWPLTEHFCAIDIEGDGHPDNRPIEISILEFFNGDVVNRHYWLINPERGIQPFVSKHIHGITNKMVYNCPTFADIADDFKAVITDKTLVGHAIKSDMRILSSVMTDPHTLSKRMVDTATLAKLTLQTKDKVSLEKACIILGIQIPDQYRSQRPHFHAAEEDAYATGQLLLELPKLLPDTPSLIKQISHNVIISHTLPKSDRNPETPYTMKP
jgi:DNA polymerase III epsilon subunit-like protein